MSWPGLGSGLLPLKTTAGEEGRGVSSGGAKEEPSPLQKPWCCCSRTVGNREEAAAPQGRAVHNYQQLLLRSGAGLEPSSSEAEAGGSQGPGQPGPFGTLSQRKNLKRTGDAAKGYSACLAWAEGPGLPAQNCSTGEIIILVTRSQNDMGRVRGEGHLLPARPFIQR